MDCTLASQPLWCRIHWLILVSVSGLKLSTAKDVSTWSVLQDPLWERLTSQDAVITQNRVVRFMRIHPWDLWVCWWSSPCKPVIWWWEESARKCFGNLWWALAAPGLSWNKAFNTKHYQTRQRFLIWTFHSKKGYLPFLLFIVNLAAWTLGTKEAMIGDRMYSILLLIAREWLWIISPLI